MAKTKKHKEEVENLEVDTEQEQEQPAETVVIIGTGKGGLIEGKSYIYPISNATILVNKGIAIYK